MRVNVTISMIVTKNEILSLMETVMIENGAHCTIQPKSPDQCYLLDDWYIMAFIIFFKEMHPPLKIIQL